MKVFLVEWAFTLAALLTLALAGGFLLNPLCEGRRFVLLLAPMCGLVTLPVVTVLIYTVGRTSFSMAASLAALTTGAVSIATLVRWRPSREDISLSLLLVAIVSMLTSALSTASSIRNGSSSLLFIDGSDHAGYAHVADWLLTHRIDQRPTVSPGAPYESWPQLMFSADPRLSSFVAVALVAWARGSSGLFAYDPTCAVVLAAGALGGAAVFSRSPRALVLLSTGLLTCVWLDLGRSGYLGKLSAYPAILLLLGLVMTNVNRDAKFVAAIVLLTIGASTLLPASAAALLLCAVGGSYVAAAGAREFSERRRVSADRLVILALAVVVAFAASGMLARPGSLRFTLQFSHPWSWLLPRLLDLQNPHLDVIRSSSVWLWIALCLAVVVHVAIVIAAIASRNAVALALAAAPLALIALLYLSDQIWIAFQIVGTVFPYGLCGAVYLSDEPAVASRRPALVAVLAAIVVLVAVRTPRFWGAVERYARNAPDQQRYAAVDFDRIEQIVGPGGTIEVDIREPLPAIAALVELGRRGMSVQWSERGWGTILAYRRWPPPTYAKPPDYRLTFRRDAAPAGELALETPQYRLQRLPGVAP